MIKFQEEYENVFKNCGFLRIKKAISSEHIKFLKNDMDIIYAKAKRKKSNIPVRCYDDIPYFVSKGVNIASIEDPFFYLSGSSIKILKNYKLSKFASYLIKKKIMSIALSRIHVTGSFNYEGPWHRDQDLISKDNDVLCNIYLMNEKGMKFIRKNNPNHDSKSFKFNDKIMSDNYDTLEAEQGDIIFMDPKLIHKPFCQSKRMHLHIRYSSIFSSQIDETSYRNFNTFYKRDLGFLSSVKRFKNLLLK